MYQILNVIFETKVNQFMYLFNCRTKLNEAI